MSNIREVNEEEAAEIRRMIGSTTQWTPAAEKAMWEKLGIETPESETIDHEEEDWGFNIDPSNEELEKIESN